MQRRQRPLPVTLRAEHVLSERRKAAVLAGCLRVSPLKVVRVHKRFDRMRDLAYFEGEIRDAS